jgi:catechol 1,2-dioxygenase
MSDPRLAEVFNELAAWVGDAVRRHAISHEEYRRAVAFLDNLGRAGEVPLLLDVFFEHSVVDANFAGRAGTAATIEGPAYVPGAPLLRPPYELPRRPDEPGDTLLFAGTVRAPYGAPLAGVLLDMWQAGADGTYSGFAPGVPEYNLRGRFTTDADGSFAVRTIRPVPYEIPKAGPTGRFLAALGRPAFRPAHLHLMLSREGYQPLTTQLYFADDPWLDADVADAVKEELVIAPERHADPQDLKRRGLDRPYFTARYDFVLAPVEERVAAGA